MIFFGDDTIQMDIDSFLRNYHIRLKRGWICPGFIVPLSISDRQCHSWIHLTCIGAVQPRGFPSFDFPSFIFAGEME
jgi:hypothetical protein